jgi:hypothetical protein
LVLNRPLPLFEERISPKNNALEVKSISTGDNRVARFMTGRVPKSLFTIFEVLEVIKVAICTWEAEAIAMGDEAEKAVSQRREPGAV